MVPPPEIRGYTNAAAAEILVGVQVEEMPAEIVRLPFVEPKTPLLLNCKVPPLIVVPPL